MTKDEVIDLVKRLKPLGVSEVTISETGHFTIKLDPAYHARSPRHKRSKVELPIDAVRPENWAPAYRPPLKHTPEMSEDEFNRTLFYST